MPPEVCLDQRITLLPPCGLNSVLKLAITLEYLPGPPTDLEVWAVTLWSLVDQ